MPKTWTAVLAAALLAACAGTPKEPPPRPFAGTAWQALLEMPLAGEQPFVQFGDGRMVGFGGCNRLHARYVQDTVGARALVIGRIERSFRGCDRGARDLEERWVEMLQSVSSYAIAGDVLTMTGSGGTLRFRARAEEAKPK